MLNYEPIYQHYDTFYFMIIDITLHTLTVISRELLIALKVIFTRPFIISTISL